ncbi:MAG: DUF58 domain-containing protein [Prevotella sp.]|nr:DUF58 domain-containing protein [Prevotella sp.]
MFLSRRFYIILSIIIAVLGSGYWFAPMFDIGRVLLVAFAVAAVVDVVLLYMKKGVQAVRQCADRFSNGDENDVNLLLTNSYPFKVWLNIIDEIPHVFQRRDINFKTSIQPSGVQTITYQLRPTQRGVYGFGDIRVFVQTVLGLVQRRITSEGKRDVKVYPSYLMLHKYELLAISNRLTELGIKRIRRVGNNTEFEQIKDYVAGDDFRTINWKASARRSHLMVNVYQDERSQQVFNVIDKGRVMQHAFHGMTLFDYAINASLVLSYIAMHKEDKAGLCTFSDQFDTFIPAQRSPGHMQNILESLYGQQTTFGETDFSALLDAVNRHVTKRSLMIVYTSFSGVVAMRRQLPYLLQLARRHRVLVVYFEDAEQKEYVATRAHTTEEHYQHVVAEKFIAEQRRISTILSQHGILNLLTTPDNLSPDIVNKYLELKERGVF